MPALTPGKRPTVASSYCGRFAPTPSGRLHFGSLVAAAGSWLHARARGGQWLVRVDDIDPPREVAGAAAEILADLDRFGLTADQPPLFQSTRAGAYRAALDRLIAAGQAFPCWCSRSALEPFGAIHRHGKCVSARQSDTQPAWRLRVPDQTIHFVDGLQGVCRQNLMEDVGDFVLLRADGCFAYHLACVVDDAFQGVTEVVRGRDLLDSTPRQICLQELLDLPTPVYRHLPLVLAQGGDKLSKSTDAPALTELPETESLAAALDFLGQQLAPGATSVEQLLAYALARFDPQRMARGDQPWPAGR